MIARAARILAWVRRGAVAAAALCLLWLAGLVWFAEDIPRAPQGSAERTDAIVVLTGGPLRLKEGLALLAAGSAEKLFVSGVNRGVELRELLRVAGTPPEAVCCIALGYAAGSTWGNAQETRAWMAEEGFRSLRLVTSSYHMRRSLMEFRRAMPDARIVPHPVFQESFKRESWWQWPGTLALVVSEYHKYLARLIHLPVEPAEPHARTAPS